MAAWSPNIALTTAVRSSVLRVTAVLAACAKSASLRIRLRIMSATSTECCPNSASSCSATSAGDWPAVVLSGPPGMGSVCGAALAGAAAAGVGPGAAVHPASSAAPIRMTTAGVTRLLPFTL